ncbi:MAG TPA: EAL domain-containing protein [Methanocorpusculum sp.]|nr:EAL domain-containing protein [Methanocorpusculum sp.]
MILYFEEDSMLYEYQYDIAAAFATAVVLALFLIRHNYKSSSSNIFMLILIFNLVAALSDMLANYTISYPAAFGVEIDMAASIIYLLAYNFELILFLLFVNSVLKIPNLKKPIGIACTALVIFEGLALVTTPFTNLVIYYDALLNYCHGPLMNAFYVIALLGLLTSVILIYLHRDRLSSYQVLSLYVFLAGMVGCIVFQSFYPQYVVGNLAVALLLVFIYVVFENPGYYTYRDTQCLNNQAFSGIMQHYSSKKLPFAIIGFELSEYRTILTTQGHQKAGDMTRSVATQLFKIYRKQAYCLSETTFAVVFKNGSNDKLNEARERLYREIKPRIFICSAQSSDIPEPYLNTRAVISAMLESHASELTAEQIKTEIIDKRNRVTEIENYLEQLIETDGFEIFYQPILDVKQNRFRSAEALVRLPFDSPIRSGPDEFIPIAERNGMIVKMGEIILKKICQFTATDEFKGLGVDYIEINLSPAQCAQYGIGEQLLSIIEKNGGNTAGINFEITETAEISGGGLVDSMELLSKHGISFSIDDFGSGFASAEYLYSLPISIVKVDKMILWHAMDDENAMKVLRSTMHMVKELGKEIVVEGVENEDMARVVRENGGDFMQGYLYSRPLPKDEYVKFLKEHHIW